MEGVQPTLGLMDIVARPNAFDRQLHSFEADLDDSAIDGGSLSAVLIQAPLIENAGPIVRVPSRYADRIVDVEEGPLIATAFHPELTRDARVHAYFLAKVRRSFLRR
jgi:pyridoxal 5'-phosphate synthase pdxT subunit